MSTSDRSTVGAGVGLGVAGRVGTGVADNVGDTDATGSDEGGPPAGEVTLQPVAAMAIARTTMDRNGSLQHGYTVNNE